MVLNLTAKPFFDNQKAVLLGIIAALMIGLSIFAPNFLAFRNFTIILLQVSVVVIIASAANLLMITGHFDLSVGSVLAFSGITYAILAKHGVPLWAGVAATCLLASVWGAVNALTVSVLRVTPVIATMGTMYAARGVAFLLARTEGGTNIDFGFPANFTDFGRGMLFDKFPLVALIMLVIAAVFIFIEKRTPFGRYAFAIGGNPSAAKLSGVRVTAIVSMLYILVAALSGFCGAFQVSRVGRAAPYIGEGLEFDVIVAIVLGGTSMLGGEGSTIGMILGALIVGIVSNGLNLLHVPFFYQEIVKGLFLIAAVFVDYRTRRVTL